MKRLFTLFVMLLTTVSLCAETPLFIFNTDNPRITSIVRPTSENLWDAFCVPIDFNSASGFNCFIQRFNNDAYPARVLPHRLSADIGQFFDEARSSKQGIDFMCSVFRLFTRRIKMTPGLDAPEVLDVIKMLPAIIEPYIVTAQVINDRSSVVKNVLYTELSENFDELQADPDKFLDKLSGHICSTIFKQVGTDPDDVVTFDDLQFAILNFLEVCMSKLVWSPTESTAVFDSFKEITAQLIKLKESGVIRHKAYLKDLVDSSVMRFCQFLSVTGAEMPLDFYKYAHAQMQGELPIDCFEEELPNLSTLREILHATLMKNVVRSTARDKFGLIPSQKQKPTQSTK